MEKTKKAKRQKLSCLGLEDLPNELVTRTFSCLNMKDLINCSQVSKRFRAVVVDEQGRRKEDLLKIIQDLQCFKCKKVPRPYGNQSKRYLCEKSHSLCIRHKKYKVEGNYFWLERFEKKCPCGSLVEKKSSKSIAKKLQNLPWMCQNYKNGCREIKMDAEELEHHERKCIFRQVFCPHWHKFCKEEKVMFKDINEHLVTGHKNTHQWKMVNGEKNIANCNFLSSSLP